jgi:glyoxylase I family protein
MTDDLFSPPSAGSLWLNNVALAVGSLEPMISWYHTVLGFTVAQRGHFDSVHADFAMMTNGSLRLELVSRPEARKQTVDRTAPPNHLNVLGWKALVLETSDLAVITAAFVAKNVEIVWANQPLTSERRSTLIRDPEGNLVNVFGPLTHVV